MDAHGHTGRGRRPRLAVAVTDSMSCVLLKGQLAFARANGYDVALICSPGDRAARLAAREGLVLLPVRMARKIAPLRDVIALARICAALRAFRPDVVNAGTPKAGCLAMLASWICRVPCRIYTLRGLYLDTATGHRRTLLHALERLTCALAHEVVCVSHSLRRRAIELGLVGEHRAVVLGFGSSNGVDLTRYSSTAEARTGGCHVRSVMQIDEGATVIGFVGRVVRDKGVVELAESWAALRRSFPHAHLLIAGSLEDRSIPRPVRTMLQSDPRVHLVGSVDDPVRYYAAMDLLVLPTYREGCPNVLLEAAAMGLPVVASAVTGCVDVVDDGATGTLVPPRDPAALIEAISAYVRDPALRERHGRAGRVRVEQYFAQERVWERLHAAYDRLLDESGVRLSARRPDYGRVG